MVVLLYDWRGVEKNAVFCVERVDLGIKTEGCSLRLIGNDGRIILILFLIRFFSCFLDLIEFSFHF